MQHVLVALQQEEASMQLRRFNKM